MEDFLSLVRDNALVILTVVATVIFPLLLRAFGKKTTAERWAIALPHIYKAIRDFVERADQLHDQILVDYAEAARETGDDPRLLWVIDQIELFVSKTFRVSLDLNWLIEQIELQVARHNTVIVVEDEDEPEDVLFTQGPRATIVD